MKRLILLLYLILVLQADTPSISYNGYVDFAMILQQSQYTLLNKKTYELSNYSLIDIPYRMGSIDFSHQSNNISLNGNLTLEYQLQKDTYFLGSIDPQDFRLDMREIYGTIFGDNYEFRFGKQIHSWGSVDENSPVDNASAFDYYYIFFLGRERKMATLSSAIDYYLGNLKINTVFSPTHTTNRLPLGNDDFPITLPIYPSENQIYSISGLPFEGGIQGTYSFGIGDLSVSYFSGYDRVFNFSGVNVYSTESQSSFSPPDLVFGYRKTEVFGFGATLLNPYVIIRGDYANFFTKDLNSSINRPYSNSSLAVVYPTLYISYPLKEKANYEQYTFQVETELPLKINFIGQYFSNKIISFSSDSLPDVEIDIPGFEYDPESMTPENLFIPGMGVPLAVITNKAAIIIMNKTFMNEQLKVSMTSLFDIEKYNRPSYITGIPGSLIEYKIEYNINEDLLGLFGITKVQGTDFHPDGDSYQFKSMENFSHFRFELKYFL